MTYQGVLFVREHEEDFGCERIYFAPSQLEEYQKYINEKKVPDGRVVVGHKVFESPVDRATIDEAVYILELEIMTEGFPHLGAGLTEEIMAADGNTQH